MNILVVSPYVPHPYSGHGGGEYEFGLIKYLSRSHQVTLATFVDQHEQHLLEGARQFPIEIHTIRRLKRDKKSPFINSYLFLNRTWKWFLSVFLWQPYMVARYRNYAMASLIENLTSKKRFDVVQIEFAQMAQYVRSVKSGKTFLREHDVVLRPAYRRYTTSTNPVSRLLNFIEFCRWRRYETRLVREFDHVLTFTEQDARLLRRLGRTTHVSCNPRGIEIPETVAEYASRKPDTMLFIGTLDLASNADSAQWLCEEIFPRVIGHCPDATLFIAGKNPPQALLEAASRHHGIKVLGFVKDIEECLNMVSLFVAPIRIGGGIKTKILHAASYGVPVVTTPRGAEGIEGIDNTNMVIENAVEGIVNGIVSLLTDRGKASAQAALAREVVERNYKWSSTVEHLETLYRMYPARGRLF